MEKRISRPTQRLTYPELGANANMSLPNPQPRTPLPAHPGASSVKSLSPSQMSFQTRMKHLEFNVKAEIDQLTTTHEMEVKKIEREIRRKERIRKDLEESLKNFEKIPSELRDEGYAPEHAQLTRTIAKLRMEIVELDDDISTAKEVFEIERRSHQNTLETEKGKLLAEEEQANDQHLDSEDEATLLNHDLNVTFTSPEDVQFSHGDDRRDEFTCLNHRNSSSSDELNSNMVKLMSQQLNIMRGGSHFYRDKDLPIFAGKAEEWPIFINEFERTTSRNPSQGEKSIIIIRLRKALKGAAKDAVLGLLDDPESIHDIIAKLRNRFGRPEFVIQSLINKVRESKPPKADNPASIIQFGNEVQNLVVRVKSMKQSRYLYDVSLLNELVSKLPHQYAEKWITWLDKDPSRDRNLSTFAEWIEKKVSVAEQLHRPVIEDETSREERRDKRKHGVHVATEEAESRTTEKVPNLKPLNVEERWKVVREKLLCFLCLRKGHSSTKCKSKYTCDIDNCGRRHHRLLHNPNHVTRSPGEIGNERHRPSQNSQPAPVPSAPPADANGNMSAAHGNGTLPIIPVWISGPKGKKKVFALLDSGASFTMVEEDVAKEIGLEGDVSNLNFTVFGSRRTEESSTVNFGISGMAGKSKVFNVRDARTLKKLGIPGISVDAEELKRKFPHLRRMRVKSIKDAVPQVLIGFDNYNLFYSKMALEPKDDQDGPFAFKSKLGWYVLEKGNLRNVSFAFTSQADEELHATVKQFFTSESFGTKPILNSERSKDDKPALELLEKYTVKKGSRWETCLLWNADNVELPSSKNMALNRLRGMEKKMDSNPVFAKMVEDKFQDYIAKGFLIPRISQDVEKRSSSKRKWYLPWFFSYHPTKKPRLVFDAAAKANGMSLNDYLLKGPDLLNPLPGVLTRFRRHQVAVTGDIKEMFHQVQLRQEDWPSQTILYRGMDRNAEPKEYYMSVLFFGSASSPCSAIYAKNLNAEQFRKKYPVAVEAILRDFYMDDFLGGAPTEDEAIELRRQVTEIHLDGGFQVVKWNSSSEKVWNSIPEVIRAEGDITFNSKEDIHVEKTLGLYWSPSLDQFRFKINFHRVKKEVATGELVPTKREMTSMIMAVFDPLGFLSPLKVKALILIQDVWRSGVGWDDQVPMNIFEKWKQWLSLLSQVENVRVNRKLCTNPDVDNAELHVFCDASEEAFASAAYVTFQTGGSLEVAFVTGKARVAPLRGLTIPKMELQAALLGSRLASTIKKTFGENLKIGRTHFWSDSKSVLCQIRSSTLRFKVFEANRIGEILELTDVSQWKWISTENNVADDATRFSSYSDPSSESRWLRGSSFIYGDEDAWPKENFSARAVISDIDMGVKVMSAAILESDMDFVPESSRFSSWFRLVRAAALVSVAVRRILKLSSRHVTMDDMKNAVTRLIRKSQRQSFPEEYAALRNKEDVKKSSRLYKLSPAMDENGVIVLSGRINAADGLNSTVKNPPILSPKDPYTVLLIKHHHEISGHHGQEKIVNELRQEAWIIDCRAQVRSCWANCVVCKQRTALPRQPEMGQIPAARLGESHRPFHHTGVDYFGPLSVTLGRKTMKRWGALFTCLSTRAVHLELVDSLDTSDMINALVRFMCLRGRPSRMWSDNGKNFVGANREMKESFLKLNQDEIRDAMQIRQVEWSFIPPSAPFMGGSWESLIGIVKRILSITLKEQSPREAILRTLFAEIMEILNNRPLPFASADPDDPVCITPNILLRLKNVEMQTVPGHFNDGDKFRKMWRYGQYLADEFWRRWIHEYLPKLAKREKWHSKAAPIQVGDLVIVVDDQSPRSGWKKGVITAVFPGKDGQVRVADVKVAHVKAEDPKKSVFISTYRRPASKLCHLGINVASSRWEGECQRPTTPN